MEFRGDFGDADYMICTVKLAGMLNHAINTLYVRRRQPTLFSERVQSGVRALRQWADGLPDHLHLSPTTDSFPADSHVLYMHLAFNQAVIVITRPVLLHLLRQQRARTSQDIASNQSSESALSLAKACVRYARLSMNHLKRSWADGTFTTFDYFSTQFLFSSATVLALSALLRGPSWEEDREDFLLACSFLHQLERNGNYGAREFCMHVEAVKVALQRALEAKDTAELPSADIGISASVGNADNQVMREALLPQPPVQDFLNNPQVDLDLGDGSWIDWQDVFLPEIEMQLPQG